jgi:hypothetical protein
MKTYLDDNEKNTRVARFSGASSFQTRTSEGAIAFVKFRVFAGGVVAGDSRGERLGNSMLQ